jgi:hypothetical protein
LLAVFFIVQALLYKNGLNCYRQMPKIWVKKSGKFNEEFKNGCKAKFLVSFYMLSALGLWILGLPLILNFSLNSRIIQLCSQLRTCNSHSRNTLGLTLGTSVAVFVACLMY